MISAPQVVPPGGFNYDRGDERVTAYDRDGLIDALAEQRVANGRDVGDPERDVDEYLLSKSSTYHPPVSTGWIMSEGVKKEQRTLLDRVSNFLINKYQNRDRNTLKFVNQVEALRRARICVSCKENREWRNSCQACVHKVERDIVLLSKYKRTALHGDLHACAVAGHSNQVAVWLDKSNLRHAKQYKLPHICWLRE